MRSSSTHYSRQAAGFTLVEVLVIAPIVILAVGAFVALMVTMVGDVLQTRDQNLMTYEAQDSLERIEDDIQLSTQFLTTTGSLPSPQGSNNNFTGTAAFTNSSNTLILNSIGTDENPQSVWRWPVYYANQPNPCGSLQSYNRLFHVTIIYFIKNGSLWRRVYVPNYNTNSGSPNSETVCAFYGQVWQRNSCSPGYTAARCQANDTELMKNISALNVNYFSSPGSTTPLGPGNAGSASSVEVTLTGQKVTAGRTVTTSASLRASTTNAPPTP